MERASHGPSIVASVFKIFAAVILGIGAAAAWVIWVTLQGPSFSTARAAASCGAIVAGAVFIAAALSFFGYVLDLLVEIRDAAQISSELALRPETAASALPPG